MTIRQSEAHTFIIRMRRAAAGVGSGAEEWHGEVVHVPSQRTVSFRGLSSLQEVIVRLVAASAQP
jgi:hypothetical protein